MKITDVRMNAVQLPDRESPIRNGILTYRNRGIQLVEIATDEGPAGIGFGGDKALVEGPLRAQLLGEDPRDLGRLWERMFGAWRKPVAKGDAIVAIGAVDWALWDLFGKIAGLPVWRLLGGCRREVPAYAAGGYYEEGKGLDELAAEMIRYVDGGYRAVKMKVGGEPVGVDVERVRIVREAVGPDVEIMVDANNAYDAPGAIEFGRAVLQYRPFWFEEPVSPDDWRGSREVRRALDIPIASGENEFTRWGFRDLIEGECVDIVQISSNTSGGPTEALKIAAMASAYHLKVAPHGQERVGQHLVAGLANSLMVETYPEINRYENDFVAPVDFRDGIIHLPDRPGLGLEVNWDAVKQHVDP
jgi:D-arabinonate dehydratase